MQALVIGVAGGTGSGKTTVARKIANRFLPNEVVLLDQDSYYKDLTAIPFEERKLVNYDHPDAFDQKLLYQHLGMLRKGEAIEKPIYSYSEHNRTQDTNTVLPAPIVLMEGILVLDDPRLRSLMDIKLFVDADDDIRLMRRLQRDIKERGRDIDDCLRQYKETVRPMHLAFILPSKRYADVVIPRGGKNDVAIGMVVARIQARLREIES
ncbi:MAG: uridine kinase [Deltaproteobacteria bacterium]|nr:MAG: uridine kinase [Deltaproteobacteria bacterium]